MARLLDGGQISTSLALSRMNRLGTPSSLPTFNGFEINRGQSQESGTQFYKKSAPTIYDRSWLLTTHNTSRPQESHKNGLTNNTVPGLLQCKIFDQIQGNGIPDNNEDRES